MAPTTPAAPPAGDFTGWRTGRDGWQISAILKRGDARLVAANKSTLPAPLVFIYESISGGCGVHPTTETRDTADLQVLGSAAAAIAQLAQAGKL